MFEQILVPLDGSKLAELALPYAEDLVEVFDAHMTLLLVCDTPECEQRPEHQVYTEAKAKQVAGEIRVKRPKEAVKAVVLKGNAAAEIVAYSGKNNVNLIAIATHGRSGIIAWALGSVAHKILHAVDVPVLLVRAGGHIQEVSRGQLFEHILVPLDGSEAGEAALPYVTELADKLSSEVILCQVVASGRHVHTIGGLDYVRFNGHEMDKARERSVEYLDGVAARMGTAKATVTSEMRIGDPAEEIIKLADEIGSCLVAMSTHGHSGIERWAFGSVTDKVIHAGKTPVLVVRAQDT
ncbi:MAG: universal stress protein [Chloroflexi bacterium]|nr:universal stress protein [Chloroflexota bacterium]